MKKTNKALILGATGLTGSLLLDAILEDPSFTEVIIIVRKSVAKKHAKLTILEGDLFDLSPYADHFREATVFVCIGTTQAKTPDKKTYKAIDYGIPVAAATLASAQGADFFGVISAMGADAGSRVFYNRIKGEMEAAVLATNAKNTHIFRPALIVGPRKEFRFGERVAAIVMKVLSPFIPKTYQSIEALTIAKAMLKVSRYGFDKEILDNEAIKKLGA